MKDALEVLHALMSGDPAAGGALLPACRAEAFGAEGFGGAMIVELFARASCPLSTQPHVVRTANGLAVFDADAEGREQALVADLYDGRIGRLWRLGWGEPDPSGEPDLFVPADAFLTQARDAVSLQPSDHPELDSAAVAPLADLGRAVARLEPERGSVAAHGRAFVVRAFSEGPAAAALLAVRQNLGDARRTERAFYAAAAFRALHGRTVHARTVIDAVPKRAALLRL